VLNTDQNYKDCLVQIIGVHETFHFTMYKKTRSHRYKVSFFDVRDIAAVAVNVLTKNRSQHENKAYDITGRRHYHLVKQPKSFLRRLVKEYHI
jgi:hypothetical protein